MRNINALVTCYGPYQKKNFHHYSSPHGGQDLADNLGVSTAAPTPEFAASDTPVNLQQPTGKAETHYDARIKKRKPDEEPTPTTFVAVPLTCRTCGMHEHATRNCPNNDEVDVNKTDLAWNQFAIGIMWTKCGFPQFQPHLKLPDCPDTHTA